MRVAAIAQISRTRMSQLESGTANPKFDTLCALAYALDCDLATLTSIVSPRHQSKKTHSEPTEVPAKSSPLNEPSPVIVYNVHPVPFKSKLEETELLESDQKLALKT
ncbi:helix-turn-helix domain-containing protein [Vibrio parahaemolyticus]|uniref:helix-turn-helix domain-containing protein n=1 Tax=Vibrio parahaemolyticus TaxID=670 RepID=UPI002852AB19|nr:helix-turn-helix domain-containing protein [Vibrio parahaemolyticus]